MQKVLSDVHKCTGKLCPKKNECLRFVAGSSGFTQVYMEPPREDGKCVLFLPVLNIET